MEKNEYISIDEAMKLIKENRKTVMEYFKGMLELDLYYGEEKFVKKKNTPQGLRLLMQRDMFVYLYQKAE